MSNQFSNIGLTLSKRFQISLSDIRADQKTGGTLRKFPGKTGMHGRSRDSSAIKYDCFKLDDSGNCIIRKTGCIVFDLKRNLG